MPHTLPQLGFGSPYARVYLNCPKFITRRSIRTATTETAPAQSFCEGISISAEQLSTVADADLFFIGTVHPERGLDASHRGGSAGFVEVIDARTLRIPDYLGNTMFNTLGNLVANARAGITIPHFKRGVVLRLNGLAETLWNQPDEAELDSTRAVNEARLAAITFQRWTNQAPPYACAPDLTHRIPAEEAHQRHQSLSR